MAAILVSTKVSVILQQDQKDFPQVFPTVYLAQTLIKHKNTTKTEDR